MKAAIYRFADNVPAWIAIPFRAVFFTIALIFFGAWLVVNAIASAACGQHIGRMGWAHDDDPAYNPENTNTTKP